MGARSLRDGIHRMTRRLSPWSEKIVVNPMLLEAIQSQGSYARGTHRLLPHPASAHAHWIARPHARPSGSHGMVATSSSSETPMAAKPSRSCSRHFGQRISPRTIVFLSRVRSTNHTGLSCDLLSRISWRAGALYRSIATFPPRTSSSRFRQRMWRSRSTRWTNSRRTFSPRSPSADLFLRMLTASANE